MRTHARAVRDGQPGQAVAREPHQRRRQQHSPLPPAKRPLAETILPSSLLQSGTKETVLTWKASTHTEAVTMLGYREALVDLLQVDATLAERRACQRHVFSAAAAVGGAGGGRTGGVLQHRALPARDLHMHARAHKHRAHSRTQPAGVVAPLGMR